MKTNLHEVQHQCHGRYILKLIKKYDLGVDEKHITFIPEDKLELSEFKMLMAARKPMDDEFYYRYKGPRDTSNRFFCHEMLSIDKVFALSEIQFLSDELGYNVRMYKGSYGCRHEWIEYKGKVIYTPPPTKNQLNVLTVNGSPYRSPWKANGYTNY